MQFGTLLILSLLSLLSLVSLASAWSPQDHEIFRIRDELAAIEGRDVTFYDFLGVSSTATLDEINKQYKKKSRQLHPDKAIPALLAARSNPSSKTDAKDKKKKPGVTVVKGPTAKERAKITQDANNRYAHLPLVRAILRDHRDRYDHFMHNGFPTWRLGGGYLYSRFRPGLGSVMIGLLIVFGGAAHYLIMFVGHKRQREFMQRYVDHARRTAWGNTAGIAGIPLGNGTVESSQATPPPGLGEDDTGDGMAMNRKQKRMQEKESRKKESSSRALGKTARAAKAKDAISRPIEAELISGPQGAKRKITAPNGKELLVDSLGNVFLLESTVEGQTQEFLIDPEALERPTIYQTALFRLPVWIYSKSIGKALDHFGVTAGHGEEALLDSEGEQAMQLNPEDNQDGIVQAASSDSPNHEARKRRAKAKARSGL